ncbi:MAG: hypothetical protein V1899_08665 [Planctomycetota bacterium]
MKFIARIYLGLAVLILASRLASICLAEENVSSPIPAPGDPPKEKAGDALPGDIDWDAVKQSFVEENHAFVLSGSAWVRYKGAKLEADNIVFYRQTREVYAEGHIRLRIGESELAAETAYMDFDQDIGYLLDAVVRVSATPDTTSGFRKQPSKNEQKEVDREKLRQLDPKHTLTNTLRYRDPFGVYLEPRADPQARANLLFRAQKLIKRSRTHYIAQDAFITSDDMVHPMYGVKASQLDFFMKDVPDPDAPGKTILKPQRVITKGGQLQVMGVSLFPLPTITYDLLKRNMFYQFQQGRSKRWGYFGLFRLGYGLGGSEDKLFDPTHIYLDLDERWERGPGGGFELDWQTGHRPRESDVEKVKRFERGEGHIRIYAVDEMQISDDDDILRARQNRERRIQPKIDGSPRRAFDANLLFVARRQLEDVGPPSFELQKFRHEFRGLVDFTQHQPLKRLAGIDNLQLDLKYQRESDRDFKLEYFQNNYMVENQPEALASLRKAGDNYSMELLYRANSQNFDGAPSRSPVDFGTFTGYEPALTYSLVPTPLYKGFYISGELQAARMTRSFESAIYNQPDFETGRMYAKVDIIRPFKWGAVNFVPHLGAQQQLYDNSRDGGEISQGAMTYGLDITSRFYGMFADLENEAMGLHGLRHILEPRISYRGISDTRVEPTDLLDFDEIDNLTALDKVTFALDQTFQTRRTSPDGTQRTINFAGLDMAVDYFPRSEDQDRLLRGNAFDLFRANGFLRVMDALKIDTGVGFNLQDGQIETATYAITLTPQTRWQLKFEERFNFRNRDLNIMGSEQIRLKFDYKLSERWGISVERIQERRRSLLQQKGRQVERFSLSRNYGAVDASFHYSIDRNVGEKAYFFSVRPVMAYRNLIVPSQELLVSAGEVSGESEAQEENNFDPFELLKRRKTKSRAKSMPPSPRPDDAPASPLLPPPPVPDKRAELFQNPNKLPPASKESDDDWTTPPPTPASTR